MRMVGMILLNVLITMIVIYLIKKFASAYNVPVLSEIAAGV